MQDFDVEEENDINLENNKIITECEFKNSMKILKKYLRQNDKKIENFNFLSTIMKFEDRLENKIKQVKKIEYYFDKENKS